MRTWRGGCVLGLALCSAWIGCSFDLRDHPASCKTSADCGRAEVCLEALCIPGSGVEIDGGAGSGASGGGSGSGANAGSGGGAGGEGGSMSDAGPLANDGAMSADVFGGSSDASVQDVGPTQATVPYAACANDMDCLPGETCRVTSGKGVCGLPCTTTSQCSPPSGGTAVATCGNDDRCKLNCAAKVGGGPPQARTCPSGMECVTEPPERMWDVGELTCYPK